MATTFVSLHLPTVKAAVSQSTALSSMAAGTSIQANAQQMTPQIFSCQISNISECLDAPPDTVGAPEFLQHIQACLFCVIASGLPCHAIFAGRMAAWMC